MGNTTSRPDPVILPVDARPWAPTPGCLPDLPCHPAAGKTNASDTPAPAATLWAVARLHASHAATPCREHV